MKDAKKVRSVVCITGAHRSGTSMLTRLLHVCGLELGPESDMMPARADNPDGFWEHLRFVALNDELLNELGGAWDLPPRHDQGFCDVRLDPLRMKAKLLIEEFDPASAWGWKDPRNSLTLPFWKSLLPRLKTLVIVRNPLEVAYSMRERNGTSYSFGLRLWEIYNRRIIEATRPEERLVRHFDYFFENAEAELRRIAHFIGLPSNEAGRAAALVTAGRRHTHFTTEQLIDARVSGEVIDLYRALVAEADRGARKSPEKGSKVKKPATAQKVKSEEANLLAGEVNRLNRLIPEGETVRRELASRRGAEIGHRDQIEKLEREIRELTIRAERDRQELISAHAAEIARRAEIEKLEREVRELIVGAKRDRQEVASAHAAATAHRAEIEKLEREVQELTIHTARQHGRIAEMEANAAWQERRWREEGKAYEAEIRQLSAQLSAYELETNKVRERLVQTNYLLDSRSISLSESEARIVELTTNLRRQLHATKRLFQLVSYFEEATLRLRSSRRWKMANAFVTLRALASGQNPPGYGHLEKIVSAYHKWRAIDSETGGLDDKIQALAIAGYPNPEEEREAQYQRLVDLYNSNSPSFNAEVDAFLVANPAGERSEQARLLKAEASYKMQNLAEAGISSFADCEPMPRSKPSAQTAHPRLLESSFPTEPIHFAVHEAVEFSIIIPVFNQVHFTQACLASIQERGASERFEVIVIDDGSTDATPKMVGKLPGVVYLRNETNFGFVASCNRGAEKARGEFLVFLNNDTVVTAGWLRALRETFDFEPQTGLVGSKLIFPDGRLQEAGGIIWRDGSGWNRGKFEDPERPEYNFLREVDYCSAACLMIRKSLFETVGGFDSKYAPAYYEDADLAFKVCRHGCKVLYQPLSKVIHYEGATGGTDLSAGAKRFQEVNRATFSETWSDVLAQKPANGDLAAHERPKPGQKRILVIDHHLPMPDRDAGSLRMSHLLKILHSLGHQVTFVPDNLADIPPYTEELQKRGIEVVHHPYINSIRQYLQREGAKFDVVILSRCDFAQKHIADVRLHAPQSRIIFDTVDLHFLRIEREAELTKNSDCKLSAGETREREYELLAQADETWVVSKVEQDLLRRDWPDKPIEVVSTIVDVPGSATPFSLRHDFLFIGSFQHKPNIDAVMFFATEIYPLVQARLSGVKFYVIGDKVPAEVIALASEDIVITGYQPEVRSYFEQVRLSVAPLRFGAGVKGKINQSMGLGVPVIATSVAAEGMPLTNREDVLIADTPEDFAQALFDLYESEELWKRLSENGVKKTKALYSSEAARKQLSHLFGETYINSCPGSGQRIESNGSISRSAINGNSNGTVN